MAKNGGVMYHGMCNAL